jgi:reductive dehalogenase
MAEPEQITPPVSGGPDRTAGTERVDERDTMFARMARRPGTFPYREYYCRRPELQRGDDRIRAMTPLLAPGARHYNPLLSAEADRLFDEIEHLKPDRSVVEEWAGRLRVSSDRDRTVRELPLALGAVAAGVAPLDPGWIYNHKGRLDDDYSRPVTLDHPRAVVFLVEMDHRAMQQAPRARAIVESARQYHRAAGIAFTVAAVLHTLDEEAKPHYDAHYDVILPPLAVAAGLGELGRNNILVADRFGSRVRIGAVTTRLPLRLDRPVELGVRRFCGICRKCAENCPSGALSCDGPVEVRGVSKWPTRVERCYAYWRAVGTDCGICMACCPFSHRDNAFHNLIRWVVRNVPPAHRLLKALDDLVYGRRWQEQKGEGA